MTQRISEHAALVLRLLQPGDTIIHKRCMGVLEEHVFLEANADGTALRGRPTADTQRIEGLEEQTFDIAPGNVTHINRIPVDVVEAVAPSWRRRLARVSAQALADSQA